MTGGWPLVGCATLVLILLPHAACGGGSKDGSKDSGPTSSETGGPDSGGDSGEPTADDTAAAGDDGDSGGGSGTCEGHAPVVAALSCENTGIQSVPDYGDMVSFTLWADVTDEDGDLSEYAFQVYFDEFADGVMVTGHPILPSITGSTGEAECASPEARVGLTLLLHDGELLAFDTEYEFGMVVTDAAFLDSNLGLVVCTTPTETGEDGGGA